jgi:hypothetical protein
MIDNIKFNNMPFNLNNHYIYDEDNIVQKLLDNNISIDTKINLLSLITLSKLNHFRYLLTLFEETIKFSNNKVKDFNLLIEIFFHFIMCKNSDKLEIKKDMLDKFINENQEIINSIHKDNSSSKYFHHSVFLEIVYKLLLDRNIFSLKINKFEPINSYSNLYYSNFIMLENTKFLGENLSIEDLTCINKLLLSYIDNLNLIKNHIFMEEYIIINKIMEKFLILPEIVLYFIDNNKFDIIRSYFEKDSIYLLINDSKNILDLMNNKKMLTINIRHKDVILKVKDMLLNFMNTKHVDKNFLQYIFCYPDKLPDLVNKNLYIRLVNFLYVFPVIYKQIYLKSMERFFDICNINDLKQLVKMKNCNKNLWGEIIKYLQTKKVNDSVLYDYSNLFLRLDDFINNYSDNVFELEVIIALKFTKFINENLKQKVKNYLKMTINNTKDRELLTYINKYLFHQKSKKDTLIKFFVENNYENLLNMLNVIKYNRCFNVSINNSTKFIVDLVHNRMIYMVTSFNEFVRYVIKNFNLDNNAIDINFLNRYPAFKEKLKTNGIEFFEYNNLHIILKSIMAKYNANNINVKLKYDILNYIVELCGKLSNKDQDSFKFNIVRYLESKTKENLSQNFVDEFGYIINMLNIILFHRLTYSTDLTNTANILLNKFR